ncbi:MAG: DUF423 domain-containing protein [Brumimicrobium sp.]
MQNKLILSGITFIFLAITLGAFTAHALESFGVQKEHIESFEVGVKYLFYNGLGLVAIAGVFDRLDFTLKPQYRGILWGTILFSSSIFALVLLPLINIEISHIIGPVTPIGGLIMIFGWFTLMIKFLRTYTSQ